MKSKVSSSATWTYEVFLYSDSYFPWTRPHAQIRTSLLRIIHQLYSSGLNPCGRIELSIPAERNRLHARIETTSDWSVLNEEGKPVPRTFSTFDAGADWSWLCDQLVSIFHRRGPISVSTTLTRKKGKKKAVVS